MSGLDPQGLGPKPKGLSRWGLVVRDNMMALIRYVQFWGGWGGWEGEQKSLPRKLPKFLLEQNIEYNEIDHEETTSTCLKKENILFRIIKI